MHPILIEIVLAIVVLVAMLVAFLIGRRIGRVTAEEQPHTGIIQAACLGVLGLVLSFSFAGAMSRFVERQDVIVRESNAVGTVWLRGDLLDPADRENLRGLLRQWMQQRILLAGTNTESEFRDVNARMDALQQKIWSAGLDAVAHSPNTTLLILPPINDMFDLLATRNAAEHRHMPAAIAVIEIIGSVLCMLIIGFAQYRPSRISAFPGIVLLVLIAVVIWSTADLDFPRHGLIRVNEEPLYNALNMMNPPK